MESSKKFLSTFDKFLAGGLGCAVIGLCILMCGFFYVWRNPPVARATTTLVGLESLPTLPPPILTVTSSPSSVPTLDGSLPPTLIPTPLPTSGEGSSASGKIVFTCYINLIDQICIMKADGTGRRQLTDLKATAFYASLSPDGQMVYFSSRETGTYEIY